MVAILRCIKITLQTELNQSTGYFYRLLFSFKPVPCTPVLYTSVLRCFLYNIRHTNSTSSAISNIPTQQFTGHQTCKLNFSEYQTCTLNLFYTICETSFPGKTRGLPKVLAFSSKPPGSPILRHFYALSSVVSCKQTNALHMFRKRKHIYRLNFFNLVSSLFKFSQISGKGFGIT